MPCKRLDAHNPKDLHKAADLLRSGELVAFPTETVYGLGALGLSEEAIQKVYNAKGRPTYNPLIMHVASAEQALELLNLNNTETFWKYAKKYWPGPLSLVGPKAAHVPLLATGGLEKVAVRVPAHPVALKLLELVGAPVVAPSANASGRPSSTTAAHVLLTLGDKIAAVLDAGPCEHGLESTVIDITQNPPVILRLGALHLEDLKLGQAKGSQGSPGRLDKHYAPLIPDIRWATRDEMRSAPENSACLTHYPQDTPTSYAKNLFDTFYRLEQAGVQSLWIEFLPSHKNWDAVRDRIDRALSSPVRVRR